MKKLVIVLLGLGVAAGVLWYKLHEAPAPDPAQTAESAPGSRLPGLTQPVPALLIPVEVGRKTGTATGVQNVSKPPSPEVLAKRAAARQSLVALHPRLAGELELTPEEAAMFFDLLARQQVEIAEAHSARARRDMEEAAEAEQAAMLGSKLGKWEQYQEDDMGRDQVDQLQNTLTSQDMSISEEFTGPLVEALTAEQQRQNQQLMDSPQGRGRDPREMLQLQLQSAAANNRLLLQVASRYLTPAQLAVYEQQLQQRVVGMERKLRLVDRVNAQ